MPNVLSSHGQSWTRPPLEQLHIIDCPNRRLKGRYSFPHMVRQRTGTVSLTDVEKQIHVQIDLPIAATFQFTFLDVQGEVLAVGNAVEF